MSTLFVVGGTWELEPWGLCQQVVDKLPGDWEPVWIPYPARYGNAMAYKESYTAGKKFLRDRIEECTDPFSILGYSQGAKIAGDIAAQHLMNPYMQRAYLIADPERHTDDLLVGPKVEGYGVAGQRRVGWKARHFAAPNDIICCNTNPVFQYIASATATMSTARPLEWLRALADVPWSGGSPSLAVRQADRFIRTKVHSSYNQYKVSNDVTVPEWIVNDIETLTDFS